MSEPSTAPQPRHTPRVHLLLALSAAIGALVWFAGGLVEDSIPAYVMAVGMLVLTRHWTAPLQWDRRTR